MADLSKLPPEMLDQLRAVMANELSLVELLCPLDLRTRVRGSIDAALERQVELTSLVLPDLMDTKRAKLYPHLQLIARHITAPEDDNAVVFTANKRIDPKNVEAAVMTALMVGIIQSAAAREYLTVNDISYRFQTVAELQKKQIIIQ